MVQRNLFSAVIFVLFSVLLSSCSGSDEDSPMRSAYIQDCKNNMPNQKTCECLFDFANDKLTEEEMLNSDLTFAYRKANGISSPKISSESETKIMGVMSPAFEACM
ncbi:MAG: hypothetical protein VYD02_00110 [Pseudomonadota bacterium]|nr:hypothetical protein [Pseudomonadota bacterium]